MIGQTISHYTILEKLGEGGMGVVYKAHDTKLDRFVALKFLPPHSAESEQDKSRFVQEAKSAAALNHPNVCSIIDIHQYDGTMFIVMEFVDGATLQEKKSSLSLKQSIDYGIQIAEGLAAAHDKGIVHRDIKPENIMVRKDGIVQVMDFGLAKLAGVSRLTKAGSTVGTLGYMSPEQVQGRETDHRSDIFSYGVLLYEMLTGRSPFNGAHESAILYEIVNVDVQPPSSVKPEIDPELDRIVMECLEKDPAERMQSIKQVAIDLNRFKRTSSRTRMSRTFPTGTMTTTNTSSNSFSLRGMSSANLPWIITAGVVVFVAVWMVFFMNRTGARNEVYRMNMSVISSENQIITRVEVPSIALSPDGKILAYTIFENGISNIYLRPLSSFSGSKLSGTTNGVSPIFSPDGQWIAFVADGKLKKVPLQGGTVETICDANGFRGASWGEDDRIYLSPNFSGGVYSVSSKGGELNMASVLDTVKNERTHRWPQVLPGSKYLMYTVGDVNSPNSYIDASIVIQSIATGERHTLDVRGEMARYIEPGYLIIARNGTLSAAPFSLSDFRLTHQPVPIVTDVNSDQGSGVTDFSVSDDGHLVYLQGTYKKELELVWVDQKGTIVPVLSQMQAYNSPRVSPDGTKLAVTIGTTIGFDNDVWIYDLKSGAFNRLTFGKKMYAPVWGSDGKTIYYVSAVPGKEGVWAIPADGSAEGRLVYRMDIPHYPVSMNGNRLVVNSEGGLSDGDILMFEVGKEEQPKLLLNTSSYESGGSVSPDGKFIVSYSNETGVFEIFVRAFPAMKGKWQISSNGGVTPRWSPDGRTIYYVSPTGRMMAVDVRTTPAFSAEPPREMFDLTPMYFPNNPIVNYDIAPDGKRFVMIRNTRENSKLTSFNIILNLSKEFERQFP